MRLSLVLALALGWGCSDPPAAVPRTPSVPPPAPPPTAADAGAAETEPVALAQYNDQEFVEAESNRDPFRSFVQIFDTSPVDAPQVEAIMPTVGVEDMRLSAVISGVASPRAMLVDPVGIGHVVQRGDFIGRAEIVQTSGSEGAGVPLHWRVERIRSRSATRDGVVRPAELVLTREDRTAPSRPPLTRVLQLEE